MHKPSWLRRPGHEAPILGFGAGLLFFLLTVAPAAAQPNFAEPAADAGVVYSGRPLVHRFEFVNRGARPIEFIDAKASCGCMKPKLPSGVFQPGQKGVVEMEVNTLGQPAGPVAWGARLTYRCDSREAEVVLVLKAQLIEEVYTIPAALQLFTSKELTAQVTVEDRRSETFKIKEVHASSPHLQVTSSGEGLVYLGHATWSHHIVLKVTEDFPEGRHEEVISVYTDDPTHAEIKIPVTIVKTAHQRVSVQPAEVELQTTPGQPVPSRIVLLRDHDDKPVTIEHITTDHPAITCSWAAGPGNLATLKVQIDHKQVPAEGLRSSVHVEVSQPVRQTVCIPVACKP